MSSSGFCGHSRYTQTRVQNIFIDEKWCLNHLYTSLARSLSEMISSQHLILNDATKDCFIWNVIMEHKYIASVGYKWLTANRSDSNHDQSWSWI